MDRGEGGGGRGEGGRGEGGGGRGEGGQAARLCELHILTILRRCPDYIKR